MRDLRQTKEYSEYMQALGWHIEEINNNYIYLKKIPFLGWYTKLQRPIHKVNLEKIYSQLSKKYKIAQFLFEPLIAPELSKTRYKSAKSISLPSKTILLDLKKSEQEILSDMKQKTRYNIKLARQNNLKIVMSQEIEEFVNLWHVTSLDRGTWLPAKTHIRQIFKSFDKNAYLLLAYSDNQLCAGLLIACSGNTAYYLYAASTKKGKQLFAPTLLAWEAIREAKKRKMKTFDFDGIYDDRFPKQTKQWIGFTKFKEGFGGKVVEFPSPRVIYGNILARALL